MMQHSRAAGSAMGLMGAPTEEIDIPADALGGATVSGGAPLHPRIRVGNRYLRMHSELIEMTDSTPLHTAGRYDLLRMRLETDGFLFVRGVIAPLTVAAAREVMLRHLRTKGAIRAGTDWREAQIEYKSVYDAAQRPTKRAKVTASSAMIPGWTVDAESGGVVGGREPDSAIAGWHAVGNSAELTAVYNGAALQSFYQQLFAQDVEYASRPHLAAQRLPSYTTLPSCTWLRAKGPCEVTAEHTDYYYFCQYARGCIETSPNRYAELLQRAVARALTSLRMLSLMRCEFVCITDKNTSIFGDYYRAQDTAMRAAPSVAAPAAADAAAAAPSSEDLQTCQICLDPKDEDSTILCELCGRGFHMACVTPRLTRMPPEEQEWHCRECCNAPMNYWTCWTALGDLSGHDGRLALIPGSHTIGGYESPARADLLPSGFTAAFEAASVWQTPTSIGMGDIILFNIKTVHAATSNASERFRLSLDTRVTSCKGRKYLLDNDLASIDIARAHPPLPSPASSHVHRRA
jgi:hypothetical protein